VTLPELLAFTDAPSTIGDVLEQFALSLREAQGQAAIEIGVRAGGTSAAMCSLAAHLDDFLVIGVDPWGNAQYLEGGRDVSRQLDYGDAYYCGARRLLATFPNHSLFRMEADAFLSHVMPRYRWWRHGRQYPTCERWLSFAYLDGPHDDEDVAREALLLLPLLSPRGRISIDNAERCPNAVRLLGGTPLLEMVLMQHHRVAFVRAERAG